ncbi:Dynamin-type G domain-containing protein [Heracleum sosnowskyi]|uniref:Dynamin-type G domain-containing protein n=1 Tax=Heracleum sosnowskyi TaxID=360622 RepID=A0AAD8MFA1_9APIA|nr:Dynamin-type G domain-containing protein [Heracleum sosnowskyi]
MRGRSKQRVKQDNNKFKQVVVKSDQELNKMSSVDESVVPLSSHAPIASSYNERIRPLLDAIDKLRNLKVMQEGDLYQGSTHNEASSELHLEYCGKVVSTNEINIAEAINIATEEIAGNGKGISHTPLTLVVKKNGVPDLTMVDLPGITRVPVHGQPENIYEQISGDRTLAVVTKSDKSPEGLRDKVMADDVNIGLGYVCVRNRIGDESYEEARMAESMLFESHPLLSKIDKSMVSVPVLARKLVQIQATIISKCLPEIVRKINGKLNGNVLELNNLPQKLSSVAEAITAFMRILGLSKESLKKLLVRGEFDEYPENKNMHCTARLAEMLDKFSRELKDSSQTDPNEKFLLNEISVLEETKSVALPNFLPRSAFLSLLQYKVKRVSNIPVNIMMHHCDNYPPLQSSTKRAVLNLISKMKEQSASRVMEIIEMEEIADYTCDPEYMAMWSKFMTSRDAFKAVFNGALSIVNIEGFGKIDVGHLRDYPGVRDEAFDLKMRLTAYWNVVLKRMVDSIVLHLLLALKKLVNQGMEEETINEVLGPQGGGIERLLDESPSVAVKRARLNQSIGLLKESREVLAKIIDRIAIADD